MQHNFGIFKALEDKNIWSLGKGFCPLNININISINSEVET